MKDTKAYTTPLNDSVYIPLSQPKKGLSGNISTSLSVVGDSSGYLVFLSLRTPRPSLTSHGLFMMTTESYSCLLTQTTTSSSGVPLLFFP